MTKVEGFRVVEVEESVVEKLITRIDDLIEQVRELEEKVDNLSREGGDYSIDYRD